MMELYLYPMLRDINRSLAAGNYGILREQLHQLDVVLREGTTFTLPSGEQVQLVGSLTAVAVACEMIACGQRSVQLDKIDKTRGPASSRDQE